MFVFSYQASVLHQDLDREPGTVDLSYQKASHFIRPFYSTSKSFLTIVRVPETMPCGKKQAIQVDFRIYQEDLEHGPKRVIFSYFVSFWGSANRWWLKIQNQHPPQEAPKPDIDSLDLAQDR